MNNDTIECMISVHSTEVIISTESTLKIWQEDKKIKFPVKKIKEIQIGNSVYHVLKITEEMYDDLVEEDVPVDFFFLAEKLISGSYSLYKYYFIRSHSNGMGGYYSSLGSEHIIKSETKNTKIQVLAFKYSLRNAFSECNEILKNVKQKNTEGKT